MKTCNFSSHVLIDYIYIVFEFLGYIIFSQNASKALAVSRFIKDIPSESENSQL